MKDSAFLQLEKIKQGLQRAPFFFLSNSRCHLGHVQQGHGSHSKDMFPEPDLIRSKPSLTGVGGCFKAASFIVARLEKVAWISQVVAFMYGVSFPAVLTRHVSL